MKEKVIDLYKKYREVIQYLIFGVLTTVVNFVVFFVLRAVFGEDPIRENLYNLVANIVAILFAYFTNRIFVFQSKAKGFKAVALEMFSFFSCRALTTLNDMFVFWLGFTVLGFKDIYVKIVSQVIVIVLNYILSKLVIFRKKGGETDEEK